MKTMRESLVWGAFNDEYPPFSTAAERKDFWARHPHPQLSRARELGLVFRAGLWTADHEAEFNTIADQLDSFARFTPRAAPPPDPGPASRDRILMSQDMFNDILQWGR